MNQQKYEIILSIYKYLAKHSEGIHHIALGVDDNCMGIERLQQLGFEFINTIPKDGADNKLICFLHPRSTYGILVELCQDKKNNF